MLFTGSVLLLLLSLANFSLGGLVTDTYEGYKIYDVTAQTDAQREIIRELAERDGMDSFTLPKLLNHPSRLLVSPEMDATFKALLSQHALGYDVINEDVSQSIRQEQRLNSQSSRASSLIDLTRYNRFDAINTYLENLARIYPTRVQVVNAGRSYEGRQIKYLRIGNGNGQTNKTVIVLDAGIHAREWIAPATALYAISELVEEFATNRDLLEVDWIVLPVVNPDGYEYSHTRSRFWRKTRRPSSGGCYGTDGNRNFDFHWGGAGTSSSGCSDTYKGPTAFSEPETVIVRNILDSVRGRAKMYLTLHSYGSYLLYPWGYGPELPSTWRDLDDVCQAGATAIRSATGRRYTVGSSTNVLYAAAGASDDYAFGPVNIPISITMELPAGGSGFDPSVSQIRPYTEESWIGIKAMARRVLQKY